MKKKKTRHKTSMDDKIIYENELKLSKDSNKYKKYLFNISFNN